MFLEKHMNFYTWTDAAKAVVVSSSCYYSSRIAIYPK